MATSTAAPAPPLSTRPPAVFGLLAFLAIVIYAAALPYTFALGSFNEWGGLVVAPFLVVLSLPVLRRMRRSESDPWVRQLLLPALLVKLLGALVRYYVTLSFLGNADANVYHDAGTQLAPMFRRFEFSGPAFDEVVPFFTGSPFIRLVTGIVYTFTGTAKLGGFLVFAWLGFLGLCLCYRAFRIAVPGGNHRLYAALVFFLPSLVFWPSSIGKDAWMQLTIGVTLYGAALVLTHRPAGYLILALGLWGTAMVRPHIALILFLALFVALLMRRSRRPGSGPSVGKLVGVGILVIFGAFLLNKTGSYFEVGQLDTGGVSEALTQGEQGSSQGGSQFNAVRVTSPVQYPLALVTVVFRPFPFEAHSLVALLAASEGMLLLFLFLRAPGRLLLQLRQAVRVPYAAFAITYTLLFAFAFSVISNFGILVRQRAQLLPLVVVLLCVPPHRARPAALPRLRPR